MQTKWCTETPADGKGGGKMMGVERTGQGGRMDLLGSGRAELQSFMAQFRAMLAM